MKILIIEDENLIATQLKTYLEDEGYEITVYGSLEEINDSEVVNNFDLLLLDLALPGKSGDTLVSLIRSKKINTPILILSGENGVEKKIELLNMGADDYLTKPFNRQELIARIKTVYRRYLDKEVKDRECYGDIVFFPRKNRVVRNKKEITLTNKENQILKLLLEHRGEAVLTNDILQRIWKIRVGRHSNIVQSTMRRLRGKLDSDYTKKIIKTVHGVGYSLDIKE
jgi:DNA-binding response OmpR family regulator